ncbi:MAG: Lrp/AsnC family transcriptional regulator [Chloroflexi bacterium]|nr:Lrp/AsnC family transcriptional regulator [Chloroflexota bacterium]
MKDRQLLNMLQKAFPLSERPFAFIAEKLVISEKEVTGRVRQLKKAGIIRQISAIFDSQRLGYKSCLVAMKVEESRIDEVAAIISNQPGVSHNYRRSHDYNLWFTLALPQEGDVERTAQSLAKEAGVEKCHVFYSLKVFKIGVLLDMVGEEGRVKPEEGARVPLPRSRPLSENDKAVIRALQEDLPLVSRPFLRLARRFGTSQGELLDGAKDFLDSGLMRRYAAVLRHRKAGFVANGMACWCVPQGRVEEVGQFIASFSEVSHCYERTTYPDWPYNLFSMIHARSTQQCMDITHQISEQTGIKEYAILFSSKEYKKERVKYFLGA